MHMRSTLLPLLLSLACTGGSFAQTGPASRAGAATRPVARYLEQERALEEALTRHDRAVAMNWLAGEFEVRSAAKPDSMDIDSWLRQELASKRHERLITDLAVREVDDLAVASFFLVGGNTLGAAVTTQFVVDIWRQSDSKLLARFISRSSNTKASPVRPTGRE